MGTFSKHNKSSLHRRGKQLLKSKVSLYKRRGTTLLRLKSKTQLFAPTIVLPARLQPSRLIGKKSIQLVHTSKKKKKSPSSPMSSLFKKRSPRSSPKPIDTSSPKKSPKKWSFRKMSPRSSPAPIDAASSPKSLPEKLPSSPSDRSTSSTSSFASIRKKLKKVSLKKMFKEGKNSPSKNDQVNGVSPWKPKDVDDSQYDDPSTPKSLPKDLSFPSSPSDRSTSTTSSFASVRRSLKKVSLKKMFKKNKKSKEVRPWEPKDVDDTQCDDDENTPPRTILFVPESGSVETADITSPNTPMSNASCSNDVDEIIEMGDNLAGTPSNGSSTGKSSPYIFADTDDEIDVQDENNKLQSGDMTIESIQTKVEQELNRLDEKLKTQKAERRAVAKQHFDIVAAESDDSMKSQNVGVAKTKQSTFLFLALMLLPVVFMIHCFFLEAFVAPYDHDIAMEFAQDFFGKSSAMKGMTVVLSETKSKLGSTIGHRFAELGATVTSLQDDIDCSNLGSVSNAIDSVLEKHDSIDYLVQTGNLCQDAMETMVSGGNYLSAFMLTQKILPSLEKSYHGTLVQFTSKTSAFATQSMSPSTAFRGQETTNDIMTKLLYMPLSFTSAKLFEIIQHRVITRAYPNVRSLEISRGWIGLGETGANDFFHRIFQEDDDASAFSSFEDEDLQESIYEWSQDAVWKWVAPPSPSPVAEMIVGSPPTRQAVVLSEQKRRSDAVAKSSYFPTSVTTVVTTGALALLAIKAKEFSWESGSTWLQSK